MDHRPMFPGATGEAGMKKPRSASRSSSRPCHRSGSADRIAATGPAPRPLDDETTNQPGARPAGKVSRRRVPRWGWWDRGETYPLPQSPPGAAMLRAPACADAGTAATGAGDRRDTRALRRRARREPRRNPATAAAGGPKSYTMWPARPPLFAIALLSRRWPIAVPAVGDCVPRSSATRLMKSSDVALFVQLLTGRCSRPGSAIPTVMMAHEDCEACVSRHRCLCGSC